MRILGDVVWWILFAYMWLIFLRVLVSWLPVRWPRGLRTLVVLVYDLTEPVLSGLRRVLPSIPVGERMALDLAPFVAVCVIALLQWAVTVLFR